MEQPYVDSIGDRPRSGNRQSPPLGRTDAEWSDRVAELTRENARLLEIIDTQRRDLTALETERDALRTVAIEQAQRAERAERERDQADAEASALEEEATFLRQRAETEAHWRQETSRAQLGTIQELRGQVDVAMHAWTALYRLQLSPAYTEAEKRLLVWDLHENHRHRFGFPLTGDLRSVYLNRAAAEEATGLSAGSIQTATKTLAAKGVFVVTEQQPGEKSKTGRPYHLTAIDELALRKLHDDLTTNRDAACAERQQRQEERRQAAAERARRAQEKRERREEQERALRQQVARIPEIRRQAEAETERLAVQLTEVQAEAEAAKREAQRIIADHRRQAEGRLRCGDCGSLIDIEDAVIRCGDCAARGTEEDRFAGVLSECGVNSSGDNRARYHHTSSRPSTELHTNSDKMAPCRECGQKMTPHGWPCGSCRGVY